MRIDLKAELEALVPPGRRAGTRPLPASPIGCLAFDPTGRHLAIGLAGHAPRVFVRELPGPEGKRESYRLDHTYDGAFFLADDDDLEDENPATDFGFFSCFASSFSPDGRFLAVQHANPNHGNVVDVNLEIYDRVRGHLAVGVGPRDEEGPGNALGVSTYTWMAPGPAGVGMVVASFDGGISLWRLSPRASVRPIVRPVDVEVPPVLAVAVDTAGTRLAVVRAGALELRDIINVNAPASRLELGVDPTAGGHVTARFIRDHVLIAWAEDGDAMILVVDLLSGNVDRIELGLEGVLGATLIDLSGGSVLWEREEEGPGGTRRVLVRQQLLGGDTRPIQRGEGFGGLGGGHEGALAVSPDGSRVARAVGATIVISRIKTKRRKRSR